MICGRPPQGGMISIALGLLLFFAPVVGADEKAKRTRLDVVPKQGRSATEPTVRDGPPCRPPALSRRDWLGVEPLLGAQRFRKPMQATPHPTEESAWWVGETEGLILEARESLEPTLGPAPAVLDVRDRVRAGEQWGLLGFAVAPGFPDDPRLFVAYTAKTRREEVALQSRVSVFESTDGGRTFDPGTEKVLLFEGQMHVWHPIAGLRFGPDGHLYIAWGEGGAGRSLVDERLLRGKLLRIDVSEPSEKGYRVPDDNPFLDGAERPEVWATGFRNPWRFSFDPDTGELWVADVGGREFEEVGRVAAGEDHGWPAREGFACQWPELCDESSPVEPLVVHSSSSVCAVIGGHVYRGKTFPSLVGKYVYGDYCAHALYAYDPDSKSTEFLQRLDMSVLGAIELDRDGEIVLVETKGPDPAGLEATSRILRLVRTGDPQEIEKFRYTTLADLGCQHPGGARVPPRGMIPYEVVVPAWDQGDDVARFMVPRFRSILSTDRGLSGRSKMYLKTLFVEEEPIETQVLAVDKAGNVGAWSYAWDARARHARLITRPTTRRLWNGREWRYETEPACLRCHSEAAGRVLGSSFRQLDTGGQLDRWVEDGTLELREDGALSTALAKHRSLVDPRDVEKELDDRARSYLHVRCGSCHRPGGAGAGSPMNLTIDVDFSEMNVCGASPMAQYPGSPADALVQPGEPEGSLLYVRMMDEGSLAMPPGRMDRDSEGTELIGAWIRGLAGCAPES